MIDLIFAILIGLFLITGVLVWFAIMLALIFYRPNLRPKGTLKGAIKQINWSYAIMFFVLPPTLVGFQDGVPLLGFSFGAGFVAFMVILLWWIPI